MGSRIDGTEALLSRRRALAWFAVAGVGALAPAPLSASERPAAPPDVTPRLFGWGETAVGDPRRYLPKARVLDRAFGGSEQPLIQAVTSGAAVRWERLLSDLAARSPEAQILAIDRFVNAIAWREDGDLYGQADHWAAPAEFLEAEAGDCEDFAIAKHVALARLGFAEERLRIALVHDRRRKLEHALAIVYWGGDALVLDSLAEAPASHAAITRYRPICSFNRRQLWVHKPA